MADPTLDDVIGWAERTGLVRLAANLRRNRSFYEPRAAEMYARIPQGEEALTAWQARNAGRRGAA
jgi:hypothetical protein